MSNKPYMTCMMLSEALNFTKYLTNILSFCPKIGKNNELSEMSNGN